MSRLLARKILNKMYNFLQAIFVVPDIRTALGESNAIAMTHHHDQKFRYSVAHNNIVS